MLSGMRAAQSENQVDDLARQADELARRQQEVRRPDAQGVRAAKPGREPRAGRTSSPGKKDSEVADLKKLEQGMQSAVRDEGHAAAASTKMREALGEMQQRRWRATCSATPTTSAAAWASTW